MKLRSTEVEIQVDPKVVDRVRNLGCVIMVNNNFIYILLMCVGWEGIGFLAQERELYGYMIMAGLCPEIPLRSWDSEGGKIRVI